MEDTWKTGDLEKHMRRGVYDEDNMRRKDRRSRDEEGKKDRSGDLEQRHRGHERNAPRERERHSERDATGRRTKPRDPDGDKDQDRQREGMRDRTGERDERDRERRREREREGERDRERDSNRPRDRDREIREKQHERAEKDSRDREKRHERGEKDSRDRDRRHERGEKDSRDRDRRHERAEKDSRDRQHERAEKDSRDRERQYERAEKDSRDRDRRRERGEKDSRDRDRRRERGEKDSRDRRHERAEKDSRDRQHEKVEKDSRDRERQYERAEKDSRDRERQYNRAENDSRDRRHEREEKDSRDKERKRRRAELDREQGTEKERRREQGRDGDREKDRERTRERDRDRERDRETDYDRRREKERHGDRERDLSSKHVKEMNDYKNELQEKYLESKRESERRERYGERDHSKRKEDKEYQEQRRKEKEEREKRHREREEEQPRDEERERRRRERREEARHRLPGGANSGVAESRDQPENRRPAKEGDRENGPVEVTSEARLHSRRDRERREAEEAEVEKDEAETEEVSAEGYEVDDGAEYYEEDFEDYEDDFDEVDESDREEDDGGEKSEEGPKEEEPSPQKRREIEEIRRAMNAENARVGSSQQRLAVEESEPSTRKNSEVPHRKNSQHGRFIDFVAAKQREVGKKIASKQKKRSTELLRLIDLDFSITFPLLDLTPVNEYDMYIKSFGTTNTKQAYVQCNEDSTDRDIQTEDIEADDKWTQHPGYGSTVCGGPKLISEASNESMAKMNIDSKRLAEFLLSASQVMAVLLEEDRAEMHSLRKLKSQAHSLSCSDGSVQLNTKLPFLHGREVSLLSFSHVQRQTLLSVHSPATNPSAVRLDSNTILCIWNIWEPSSPQKVLVYESEVLCCCFSPGRAALVFAGTAVGSVVVWDLREHSGLHQTLTIGDHDWTLRYPTFSTDAVLSLWSHSSSVRSVEAAPVAMAESARPELSLLPSHQESSGLSFELASLDESGVMNLWVVVELPKGDQAGSQTDLGLKPGGKVKLLHSSTLIINERSSHRDAVNTGPPRTLLLKFLPSDSNHFFIGTDMGLVTHGTRHGLKTVPKFYGPQEDGLRPVHITAVDVSPFGEPLFLVGSADGSIRLHSVSRGQPVAEWSRSTAGQPVLCVQWALTRPAVFCVLDAASNLHLWDLAEKDYEPVTTQKLHSDRVTAMAVFGDPAKPNTLSGVCLASQSGEIEVQYFSKRWAVPAPAELETLLSKLNEAF